MVCIGGCIWRFWTAIGGCTWMVLEAAASGGWTWTRQQYQLVVRNSCYAGARLAGQHTPSGTLHEPVESDKNIVRSMLRNHVYTHA